MFKIEIRKGDFGVEVESDSISDENKMRKLIDDITEKFNHKEGSKIDNFDVTEKKLSS